MTDIFLVVFETVTKLHRGDRENEGSTDLGRRGSVEKKTSTTATSDDSRDEQEDAAVNRQPHLTGRTGKANWSRGPLEPFRESFPPLSSYSIWKF